MAIVIGFWRWSCCSWRSTTGIFGLVADLALMTNLVLVVALLSMLQAALTLPGIAGIVLTVGMAVDANVLIFERIREELRNGNSPQASISAGYDKALSTIARRQHHDAHRCGGAVRVRHRADQGFRGDAVDRHPDVDVHGDHRYAGAGKPDLRRAQRVERLPI